MVQCEASLRFQEAWKYSALLYHTRSLHINEASYPLKVTRGRAGANILDCDGTVCGGEVRTNQSAAPGHVTQSSPLIGGRCAATRACACWRRGRSRGRGRATSVSARRATPATTAR